MAPRSKVVMARFTFQTATCPTLFLRPCGISRQPGGFLRADAQLQGGTP
jgi:hypothetical protein